VTDSNADISYKEGDTEKAGINNLMTIYSVFTKKSFAQIENEFSGKGYGDFKLAVGEVVADALKPIRDDFARFSADKEFIKNSYSEHAQKASHIASKIITKVYRKVGFPNV
jgi:tryptophanyl-tRNA synthetase